MASNGRRDERRAHTRQALAEAALEAFLDRGFDAVTVDEITGAAGVSPRTFFLHFPSKAAAVFPDHDENLAWFRGELAALPDPGDVVADLCDLIVEGVRRQESTFRRRRRRLVHASAAVREIDARTDRDYEEAVTEHLRSRWGDGPGSALPPRVVANVVIGVARAALDAWAGDGTDPVTATRETLDRLLLPPLRTPPLRTTLGTASSVGRAGPGDGDVPGPGEA